MKKIAIFAKPAKFFQKTKRSPYPHLMKGSSLIRGEQVAEYLGAKYNPTEGYENDVRIYIKPSSFALTEITEGSYVDVVDTRYYVEELSKYPKIGIITCSQTSYEWSKARQLENKIVFIPQHHCNFDRILRDRKEITTVGVIGSIDSFDYPFPEFSKKMEKIGLKFITNHSFKNRQDVIDFYKQVDIQVSWNTRRDVFKNPMRIINAASFGIPTVAFPEVGFREFDGNYIAVKSIEDLIGEVEKLKDMDYYNQWSDKIIKQTEPYHISKIAEKYRQLCT